MEQKYSIKTEMTVDELEKVEKLKDAIRYRGRSIVDSIDWVTFIENVSDPDECYLAIMPKHRKDESEREVMTLSFDIRKSDFLVNLETIVYIVLCVFDGFDRMLPKDTSGIYDTAYWSIQAMMKAFPCPDNEERIYEVNGKTFKRYLYKDETLVSNEYVHWYGEKRCRKHVNRLTVTKRKSVSDPYGEEE